MHPSGITRCQFTQLMMCTALHGYTYIVQVADAVQERATVQQANAELQERILVLDKQLQEQRSEVAATKAHLAAREQAMHAQLGSCQSQLTAALAEVQVLRERYQERALERDRLQQVNVGTVSGMT